MATLTMVCICALCIDAIAAMEASIREDAERLRCYGILAIWLCSMTVFSLTLTLILAINGVH
jgi:hypothetical protein